jgi:predicted negative regulator of RcsB-dependent stress response
MTDNEIIKAYEMCYLSDEINCGKCAFTNCPPNSCKTEMTKSVFELINLQKAEIAELKSEISTLTDANKNLQDLYREEQAKVEMEKQKVIDAFKKLKAAKSEAIRDFVSDLSGKAILVRTSEYSEAYYAVKTGSIGSLAIEKIRKMTEDKNV